MIPSPARASLIGSATAAGKPEERIASAEAGLAYDQFTLIVAAWRGGDDWQWPWSVPAIIGRDWPHVYAVSVRSGGIFIRARRRRLQRQEESADRHRRAGTPAAAIPAAQLGDVVAAGGIAGILVEDLAPIGTLGPEDQVSPPVRSACSNSPSAICWEPSRSVSTAATARAPNG